MSRSLQDQLVDAGLASHDQGRLKRGGKKGARDKPRRKKGARRGGAASADSATQPAKAGAASTAAPKSKRQQKREHQERVANVVAEHARERAQGEVPYRFTRGRHVKETWVSREERLALASGQLALVAAGRRYALVPMDSVASIREVDPNAVLVCNDPDAGDRDVEYGPAVPDDLSW